MSYSEQEALRSIDPKKLKKLEDKAKALDDILEFFAENFEWELLELIGSDKCVEHFDLKLHHERCWKEGSDR